MKTFYTPDGGEVNHHSSTECTLKNQDSSIDLLTATSDFFGTHFWTLIIQPLGVSWCSWRNLIKHQPIIYPSCMKCRAHELSRRGAKHLQSAASSQVKCKSIDSIEGRLVGHSKISNSKHSTRVNEGMEKQKSFIKSRSAGKIIANIAIEKRRNKDLDALKKKWEAHLQVL